MNTSMVYELRRPTNIEPGKKYPALFVMHGIGSNEKNMLSLVDGLDESLFIFSIRGHISQGPGFAYFTIQGYGKPHREVFDDAIIRLTAFINNACDKYPIDLNRLYLLGFSQGAILAMTLGLTLGYRIKGIVALSGYIPSFVKEEYNIQPVEELSVFISHGQMDQVLPYEWGQANESFFSELGANVTFRSYPEPHTVSEENLRDFQQWFIDELQKNKGV
ncbi:esterase [Fodinisporobacter ferrooxydans]|uniref:Esterase n=1 Tax=Fodinisporobacter ferrooxydans TaxID=2901836 RepID=A0ABY4CJD1_9BACL|nr:esterase [Alicyclobacillaceae bacterium MYW30-H2]